MPSPFPGMDPFLEHPSFWLDFHSRLINFWCEAIAEKLPGDYEASIGERVYLVDEDPESRKLIFPDVAISLDDRLSTPSDGSSAIATLEPFTIPVVIPEGTRESYIELLQRPERSLVAVLDLLSPTNKSPPGRTEYMMKRGAILLQSVHLVELDLLRGGRRPSMRKPWPKGDSYYMVSRYEDRPDSQVYSWGLRQPLPTLPTPL